MHVTSAVIDRLRQHIAEEEKVYNPDSKENEKLLPLQGD